MTISEKLLSEKNGSFKELEISQNTAEKLGTIEKSELPEDYKDFVEQIGFGEVGDGWFMLYSGIVLADEIFGEEVEELKELYFFGDDMQGIHAAIDKRTNTIVEVDSSDMSILKVSSSFTSYMENLIY